MLVCVPTGDHDVWSRPQTSVVVPQDLTALCPLLRGWFDESVHVVVDRRAGLDRRTAAGCGPDGADRRAGERRAVGLSAADADVALPRAARPHAGRLLVVEDLVPVHHRDDRAHAGELVDRSRHGDEAALDELDRWLQPAACARLAPLVGRDAVDGPAREAVDAVLARVVGTTGTADLDGWLAGAAADVAR